MSLTAGAPSHVLLDRLEKAGWGNLAGPEFRGVRGTLAALTRMLDPKSAQGKATAWQIAERAGYTERWTRRCLKVLEELDLIEWDRGGVVDGKPVPSWFRISKRALLILVSIARTASGERRTERQAEVRDRVTKYRLHRTRKRQKRRPDHAELITALPLNREVPQEAEPPADPPPLSREAISDAVARVRAEIRASRGRRPTEGRDSKTATTRRAAIDPAQMRR